MNLEAKISFSTKYKLNEFPEDENDVETRQILVKTRSKQALSERSVCQLTWL